jgi:two-component sensor histidine kinase
MEISELFLLAENLEEERAFVMSGNNIESMSLLFSDDLYYGHASGLIDSKAGYLDKLRNKVFRYKSVKVDIRSVTALDEHAFMVSGSELSTLIVAGEENAFEFTYMGVWRKEKSHWKFVGHQTAIAKK